MSKWHILTWPILFPLPVTPTDVRKGYLETNDVSLLSLTGRVESIRKQYQLSSKYPVKMEKQSYPVSQEFSGEHQWGHRHHQPAKQKEVICKGQSKRTGPSALPPKGKWPCQKQSFLLSIIYLPHPLLRVKASHFVHVLRAPSTCWVTCCPIYESLNIRANYIVWKTTTTTRPQMASLSFLGVLVFLASLTLKPRVRRPRLNNP